MVVAAAHAFVDGVFQAAAKAGQAHIHADLDEHIDDAGVLADRPVAGGAHLGVGQDLRDRILGRSTLLALVSARQMGNVVGRMVVADVLQRSGDGFDQVGLGDGRRHDVRTEIKEPHGLSYRAEKALSDASYATEVLELDKLHSLA